MKSSLRLLTETALLLVGIAIIVLFFRFQPSEQVIETASAPSAAPPPRSFPQEDSSPWPGYTLYATSGTAEIVLLDPEGAVLKTWPIDADRVRLLQNCNLLVVHGSKWGIDQLPWGQMRHIIREYSWDGEVVWEHSLPDAAHHDIRKLPNGNILTVYMEYVPEEVLIRKLGPRYRRAQLRADVVVELSPEGEVVWKWKAYEHLPLTDCGARTCPKWTAKKLDGRDRFDWTHVNTVNVLPPNRWYDEGDQRFRPGNIMIFPRNFWSALIVDRETGEVVWRYHGDYKGGISGGHESYMIPKGVPGAGNILIFDNGRVRNESVVLEVDPVSKELVWIYENGTEFFSRVAGSAQRLPNGNTLVSEDVTGRVFEVSADGEIVWSHHLYKHRINRAHRYPLGYCSFLTE